MHNGSLWYIMELCRQRLFLNSGFISSRSYEKGHARQSPRLTRSDTAFLSLSHNEATLRMIRVTSRSCSDSSTSQSVERNASAWNSWFFILWTCSLPGGRRSELFSIMSCFSVRLFWKIQVWNRQSSIYLNSYYYLVCHAQENNSLEYSKVSLVPYAIKLFIILFHQRFDYTAKETQQSNEKYNPERSHCSKAVFGRD